MGILHNITLTVSLIWAVIFRVYPTVTGTISPTPQAIQTTVIQDTHKTSPITDSAVYLVQDEDEQQSPTVDHDFLPSLPTEWVSLLMALIMLQPILRITVAKRAGPSQPYYLLFCSLRIPSV